MSKPKKPEGAAAMKLTVNAKEMSDALQILSRITGGRTTLPICSNILLRADGDTLHLAATNLDNWLALTIPAEVATPGVTTTPCLLLFSLANRSTAPISLALDGSRMAFESGNLKAQLYCLDAAEFPPFPESGNEVTNIECVALKRALSAALPFASDNASRYTLHGAMIGAEHVVCTNGNALSEVGLDCGIEGQPILATASAKLLSAILPDSGEVSMSVGESTFDFKNNGSRLSCRRIDGTYPNWKQVIPKVSGKGIIINRESSISALRTLFVFPDSFNMPIKITPGSPVQFSATHEQRGNATIEVEGSSKNVDGPVTLNGKYLLDALTVMTGETVFLDYADKLTPITIREDRQTIVIMPIRTE